MSLILRSMTVLIVLLALSAGCTKKAEKKLARPPAPVLIATVGTADIPQRLIAVGTVEATESVVVRPQISGELSGVFFKEGQEVSQGQKLFQMDPRSYNAALKKVEASLARNRIIMENAFKDHNRYAQLVKEGIVTQEQAEAYRTKADSASADVEADKAAVENARVQLSYTTMTAPIAGRLGNLMVSKGNVVEANKTTLVTLNAIAPIYVTFSLPERELAAVRARMAAGKMVVEAELPGGLVERGLVSFLDNLVDTSTGTIKLKGRFDNISRRLWPGQFVQVVLTLAERKGLVAVPSQALQTGQKGTFVYVVRPNLTAEMRPVVTGGAYNDLTAIDKGLVVGEQVVIDGQLRLLPDARLEIKKDGQSQQKNPEANSKP